MAVHLDSFPDIDTRTFLQLGQVVIDEFHERLRLTTPNGPYIGTFEGNILDITSGRSSIKLRQRTKLSHPIIAWKENSGPSGGNRHTGEFAVRYLGYREAYHLKSLINDDVELSFGIHYNMVAYGEAPEMLPEYLLYSLRIAQSDSSTWLNLRADSTGLTFMPMLSGQTFPGSEDLKTWLLTNFSYTLPEQRPPLAVPNNFVALVRVSETEE